MFNVLNVEEKINMISKNLKYNSIAICIVNVKKDYAKDNGNF